MTTSGQPFMIEISDGPRVHSLGSGMIRVPVNQPAVVSIDPRRAGTNLTDAIVAEVIGKTFFLNWKKK